MYYENMPLYPGMRPNCGGDSCMKVRLFDDNCGGHRAPPMDECERVMIDNPCRPGERAEVVLGVDDCGNLVICVHRVPRCDAPCGRPSRPGCRNERCIWPEPCKSPCRTRRRGPEWVCS